jgi:predicted DsbA family dithiol-disulfide isomerase
MVPTAKPNTGPALRLLAHAKAKEPMQADRLGGILYHALWVEGMDLSDPAVLAQAWTDAGYPRAISGEDVTPVITQWSREWVATGTEVVPLLVREDGRELRGLTECAAIQQFFSMARTSR